MNYLTVFLAAALCLPAGLAPATDADVVGDWQCHGTGAGPAARVIDVRLTTHPDATFFARGTLAVAGGQPQPFAGFGIWRNQGSGDKPRVLFRMDATGLGELAWEAPMTGQGGSPARGASIAATCQPD
ncbi:hypothetical protein [Pseudooceanicola nanhaiensis]|uniref:hypothetical protein n=1 Tax=Pseudooceanicola nanhaiensis TaxID=375761 RepID=UPI001CD5C9E9|nr:hypothetical protein [Pseudooceanicola nanhaiensis]MCA0921578.1 hypothetical protein [Pseudooceanicola nanhaiensis]